MNETLKKDTTEFSLGDFAAYVQIRCSLEIGIVTEMNQFTSIIEYPFDGYPFRCRVVYREDPIPIIKVLPEEALHRFRAHSNSLEKQVESAHKTKDRYLALRTGIIAWEKYYLDLIIQKLEMAKSPLQRYKAMKTEQPPPRTGVYVIEGHYLLNEGGDKPSPCCCYCWDGLLTSPRLSEGAVIELLEKLAPKGFGDIPETIKRNQEKAESTYNLRGYSVYELPKGAIELVKERNPKRIDIAIHLA